MLNLPLIEQAQIVSAFPLQDLNTSSNGVGDWVSMKNYSRCLVVFHKNAGTAGDDPVISLAQATAVAGTSSKALQFKHIWHKIGATALSAIGTFTKVTITTPADTLDLVSVNSTDLLADVGEAIIAIEVKADDLDVDNGFDCIQFTCDDTSIGNAVYGAAYYILYGSRQSVPLSAIAD